MRTTFTASVLAVAGATGSLAANNGGSSSKSISLNSAVGNSVASAVGSSLGKTGWSWGLGDSSGSGNSKRGDQPAEGWLKNNINLFNGKISSNPDNVILTSDPSGGSSNVLSVKYGSNSYGLHTHPSGGTSFYSQPFLGSDGGRDANSNPFVSSTRTKTDSNSASRPELLLTYSVYFPEDFDFVKGGKLPGLYSSVGQQDGNKLKAETSGCEGGSEGDIGKSCWSTRIMWRKDGQAEIYAYIPTSLSGSDYKLCPADSTTSKGSKLICNSDYGTSIGRGGFSFEKGKWNDLALHIKLNSEGKADGLIQLFHNGESKPSIHLENIVFRTGGGSNSRRSLDAPVEAEQGLAKRGSGSDNWVDKIMFTTFFGGSGSEWATPHATQTYYKNFALFAGSKAGAASKGSGSGSASGSSSSSSSGSGSGSGSGSSSSTPSKSASSSEHKPTSSHKSGWGSASGSGSGSGSDSSPSSSQTSTGHQHHHHHHHHSTSSSPSSAAPTGWNSSSESSKPTATSSNSKGRQCQRKKSKHGPHTSSSSGSGSGSGSGSSGQRRRSTRAQRDAAVQARSEAHIDATFKRHHRHHRSQNYMRARNGIWA